MTLLKQFTLCWIEYTECCENFIGLKKNTGEQNFFKHNNPWLVTHYQSMYDTHPSTAKLKIKKFTTYGRTRNLSLTDFYLCVLSYSISIAPAPRHIHYPKVRHSLFIWRVFIPSIYMLNNTLFSSLCF